MKDNQIVIAECIDEFKTGLEKCNRPEDRATVEKYLSSLAVLLSKLILGKNIKKEANNINRLFGNTWLIDIEPFNDAMNKWKAFKY